MHYRDMFLVWLLHILLLFPVKSVFAYNIQAINVTTNEIIAVTNRKTSVSIIVKNKFFSKILTIIMPFFADQKFPSYAKTGKQSFLVVLMKYMFQNSMLYRVCVSWGCWEILVGSSRSQIIPKVQFFSKWQWPLPLQYQVQ